MELPRRRETPGVIGVTGAGVTTVTRLPGLTAVAPQPRIDVPDEALVTAMVKPFVAPSSGWATYLTLLGSAQVKPGSTWDGKCWA